MFTVQTNSSGFRTHEFYPKLAGEYRIVLMGDSFTYGVNANQDETIAAVMEKRFREAYPDKNIRVFSLGVSSYSGVRYANLARLYIDSLEPDMIIVSVDQSDFREDLSRFGDYQLDENGFPSILKYADRIIEEQRSLVIDAEGIKERLSSIPLMTRIRAGSSLINFIYELVINAKNRMLQIQGENASYPASQVITYESLVLEHGDDLTEVLPPDLLSDTISYTLEKAISVFEPTFRSLQYVALEAQKRNIPLFFASYPYPWMVSIDENIPNQINRYGAVYDFRSNRVHPNLMQNFADRLGVVHLNAYPVFEAPASQKRYGDYDPHFNAYGFKLYSDFLSDSIEPYLQGTASFQAGDAP
jgi:hypothetical protein